MSNTQQAHAAVADVSKEEITQLIQARKLLKEKVNVSWYWAIFMIGIVAPALFAPIILIASAPASVIITLYLLIVPARRLKKNIAALNVKVHETRNLSIGDFCGSPQAELPLYQIIDIQEEPKLLTLKTLLSKEQGDIGKIIRDQREQFLVPYLFND
ncbi:hypothetical protein [Kiloniella majae]|uniref:hypothetical protein n=1 Tax=Kiloniella majae TaxID=1938558 RepID=UPI000A277DED|nr:hypothetical protein [Kiloniella majae]